MIVKVKNIGIKVPIGCRRTPITSIYEEYRVVDKEEVKKVDKIFKEVIESNKNGRSIKCQPRI